MVVKIRSKNGRKGALKRTRTPNNPDVNPAKKANIKVKRTLNTSSSLERIKLILVMTFPLKINKSVRKIKTEVSSPLINSNGLRASQIPGLYIAVNIAAGAFFSIPEEV